MDSFDKFLKFGSMDDENIEETENSIESATSYSFGSAFKNNTANVSGEYHGNDDFDHMYNLSSTDFDPDDGMIVPDIKPKKKPNEKPCIVVIDDDFSTLDLMKIYLQRDYIIKDFSNPKDAIFYMNTHLPDLIFLDCFMTTIPTKQILSIIRSYAELKEVPIYYTADESEESAVRNKLTEDISGIITRPIARGKLQEILDTVFKDTSSDADSDTGDADGLQSLNDSGNEIITKSVFGEE